MSKNVHNPEIPRLGGRYDVSFRYDLCGKHYRVPPDPDFINRGGSGARVTKHNAPLQYRGIQESGGIPRLGAPLLEGELK